MKDSCWTNQSRQQYSKRRTVQYYALSSPELPKNPVTPVNNEFCRCSSTSALKILYFVLCHSSPVHCLPSPSVNLARSSGRWKNASAKRALVVPSASRLGTTLCKQLFKIPPLMKLKASPTFTTMRPGSGSANNHLEVFLSNTCSPGDEVKSIVNEPTSVCAMWPIWLSLRAGPGRCLRQAREVVEVLILRCECSNLSEMVLSSASESLNSKQSKISWQESSKPVNLESCDSNVKGHSPCKCRSRLVRASKGTYHLSVQIARGSLSKAYMTRKFSKPSRLPSTTPLCFPGGLYLSQDFFSALIRYTSTDCQLALWYTPSDLHITPFVHFPLQLCLQGQVKKVLDGF